jgi:hypothetical protein
MNSPNSFAQEGAKRALSRAAGKVAVAVGLLVLAGWLFDIDILKRVSSRSVEMNPVTAICFVLIGIAFECLRTTRRSKWAHAIGAALALLVVFIGAVKASSYVFGWGLRIDALLFGLAPEEAAQRVATQMASNTALNFIYVGAWRCV